MRYIIRTCDKRLHMVKPLLEAIPHAELAHDEGLGHMYGYAKALEMAGQDGVVNMEEDIILCDNFCERVEAEIAKRPHDLIQFFSMRKDDHTIGSRYIPGHRYLMGQCQYFPPGFCAEFLEWFKDWDDPKHPNGSDKGLAIYLGQRKMQYWNVVPNLVDHLPVESAIHHRRPRNRKSFTFKR